MESIPEESKCIIETKDGPICGYKISSDEGSIFKFKSIPYATPPVGRHRFLPPSPAEPWTELKDCTQDAPLPLQYYFHQEIIGSEDCLYIEISTPSLRNNKQLPVMFWISGYSFAFSVDRVCDPTLINANEVVFVRCGFRLGPFGFLSVNDFAAPGNCGLKDIIMALLWVQRNIRAFGGDPTNVTIFGSSAGGALVHLIMLSPMGSGLFHKAIIQGASAINNWTLDKNPTVAAVELANILGIKKSYKPEIVDELRTKPVADIMLAFAEMTKQKEHEKDEPIIDTIFRPCIEEEFEGQVAFLTRYPAKTIRCGHFNKVPLMIGSNNVEASFFQANDDYYKVLQNCEENVALLAPKAFSFDKNVSMNIGNQLMKYYLGDDEKLRHISKSQYIQIFKDYNLLYYVNKTVRLHSKHLREQPIYYYILDYVGEWAFPKCYNYYNYFYSTGHGVEIPFIFDFKYPGASECIGTRDSLRTRNRVVKMWTNFAKYGNPTPDSQDPLLQVQWDPIEGEDKLNYMNIGTELTKGRNPFHERMVFWDKLHKENLFSMGLIHFNESGISW